MSTASPRYTAVAIVLHWAIAIAILAMIPLGWWMGDALEALDTQAQAIAAYQLHKSIGLTVLALSLVRLGWRLTHAAPPLPAGMKAWEKTVAAITHWAFYVLMIALPLTGWLYVSTAWSPHDQRPLEVPTLYFGLFQVPHLFGLSSLADAARAGLAGALEFGHSKLAWAALALTALHAGAALKHQFADRDNIMARMAPVAAHGDAPGRGVALLVGFAGLGAAIAACAFLFLTPPGAAPAPTATPSAPVSTSDSDVQPPLAGQDAAAPDAPALAPNASMTWTVAPSASAIRFSGVHAGTPFEGRFGQWRADIRFDPNNLDASSAVVTIQTGSATDGVPLHDQSLPGAEWFDAANHPTATFRTSSIRARGDGVYEARGTLTIKDRGIDVRLPFTLSITGDRATMDGTISIDRREADLGMSSDPDADYVSREITVRVHVEANRAP